MIQDPNKAQLWKERIQEQEASGLSIRSWCMEHQISQNRFFYWKRRLHEISQEISFAELSFSGDGKVKHDSQNFGLQSSVSIEYKVSA